MFFLSFAVDGFDGLGLQLEKIAKFFKFFLCNLEKLIKLIYSLFFIITISLYFLSNALQTISCHRKGSVLNIWVALIKIQ